MQSVRIISCMHVYAKLACTYRHHRCLAMPQSQRAPARANTRPAPRSWAKRVSHKKKTALDPDSGRKMPSVWHGAGAWHGVFIPETQ